MGDHGLLSIDQDPDATEGKTDGGIEQAATVFRIRGCERECSVVQSTCMYVTVTANYEEALHSLPILTVLPLTAWPPPFVHVRACCRQSDQKGLLHKRHVIPHSSSI